MDTITRKRNMCDCLYDCYLPAIQRYKNYCSYQCENGCCVHAVGALGQNIGREMCNCISLRCRNAVSFDNSTNTFSKFCGMKCKEQKCNHKI